MRYAAALAIVLSLVCVPFAQAQCPTLPAPAVQIVSGQDNSCTLQTVVLEASGYPSYVWDNGTTSSTRSYTPSTSGRTQFYVRGVDANGCRSEARYYWLEHGQLTSTEIVGYDVPTAICSGGVGGTLRVEDIGGGNVTHQWGWQTTWDATTSTPIPSATGETYQIRASDMPGDGRYWFSVVSTPECGEPRRDTYGPFDIGNNMAPPSLGVTPATCREGYAVAQVIMPYDSYLWTIQGGEFSEYVDSYGYRFDDDPTKPMIAYRPTGDGPVTLTVTVTGDGGGCSATATTTTVVQPAPAPVLYGPAAACTGSSRLVVQTNHETASTRQWSATNATLEEERPGFASDWVWVTPDGSGLPIVVTLTHEPYRGCVASASHTINVGDVLPLEIDLGWGQPDPCVGATASAGVYSSHANYTWSITNGEILAGQGSSSISYRATSPDVTLSVSASGGYESCPGAGTRSFTARTIDPVLEVTATAICPGEVASARIGNLSDPFSVQWSVEHGVIRVNTGDRIHFESDGSGPLTVTALVSTSDGCAKTLTRTIPFQNGEQAPEITVDRPNTCYYGLTTATAPAGYRSYNWNVSGGTIVSSNGSNQIVFRNYTQVGGTVRVSLRADGVSCRYETAKDVPVTSDGGPYPPIQLAEASMCMNSNEASIAGTYDFINWTVDNGTIWQGQGTTRIVFGANGNGAPTVRVAVNNGHCGGEIGSVTVPFRIQPPVVQLGAPDVCPMGSSSASIEGTYEFITWYLSNGEVLSGQGTNSIVFRPMSGTEPVEVRVQVAKDGCSTYTEPVMVPMRTIPPPTVRLGAPDVCPMGSNSATIEGTYEFISWYLSNGEVLSGHGTNTIVFRPTSRTEPVEVRVQVAKDGCDTYSAVTTVPIRTIAAPTVRLGAPDVCPMGSNSATIEGPYEFITWYLSNGEVLSGHGTNTIVFRPTSRTEPVEVRVQVAKDGCDTYSAVTTVPIRTIAAPTVRLGAPDVCPMGSNSATIEGTWELISWYVPNGEILSGQGTNTIVFRPMSSGTEPVEVRARVAKDGCDTYTDTVMVPIRTLAAPVITLDAPRTCYGATNGASVPAQYSAYNWVIENGTILSGQGTSRITFQHSGSAAATLRLLVGADGCEAAALEVTVPSSDGTATITASGPTTFCAGGNVTLTASNGASYLWSNGATTQSITVSAGGSYSVTVTDASGCTATSPATNVTVHEVATPIVAASGPTTFCEGGSVTLTAPSASSYLWSNGATTQSITVTASGSYSVTITNANGCSATSAATTVTANAAPATPAITASGPTTFCEGGSVTLTAPSASSYLWSNGATTQSVTVTSSGNYSVTVSNANGCSATSAATTVTANAAPATPTITASGATTFCEGGSVTLTAPAASTYLWSNGATTQSITVTSSGNYSVTITNANGCSATSAATTVTANAAPATPTITASGATTFCEGGNVTLTAPTASSYLWSNGATTQSITVTTSGNYSVTVSNANGCSATSAATTVTANAGPATPTITASGATTFCEGGSVTLTAPTASSYLWSNGATTQSITVTTSGSYSVTITNANGCSASSAATQVTVQPLPEATITAGGPTTFCEGGSVTLTAPENGYAYAWSNGASTRSITVTTGGSYTVTVTNANGCSATSAPASVTVRPLPPSTISGNTTFCAGSSTLLSAPSGGGYTYLWSTGSTDRQIGVSTAGTYSLTVTDANGCSSTSSVNVTVNTPAKATITADGPTRFCPGGSVTLTANEGASYSWYPGGETTRSITVSPSQSTGYRVTLIDANGCSSASDVLTVTVDAISKPVITVTDPVMCAGEINTLRVPSSTGYTYLWSNGATTNNINITEGGTYSVTVTNSTGCSATSDPVTIVRHDRPTATVSGGGSYCATGSATIRATLTGTAPWSVTWSDGVVQSGLTQSVVERTVSPSSTTTYRITAITDANCGGNTSGEAVVTVNSVPSTPAVTASGPTTFCEGGSVTLTAPSGYSYLWSNGATTRSTTVSTSGNYTVTVTTAGGCSSTSEPTTVTVQPRPATPAITTSGPTTFCEGGSVTLTAPAGYTYLWSNGATTQSINVTSSGSYSVTVTNENGCSATSAATTVTVNAKPSTPAITAGGATTFCEGGSVTLAAPGGSYTYLWSNGATTQSINVTTSGSYSVTITNANGCSATSAPTTVTVNAKPSTPAITVSGATTFCEGGSVTLTAPAGYSYLWSNGATTQSITATASGSYSVTVTNANGCSATSAPTTVTTNTKPATPAINTSGPTTFCEGGSVTLTAPSGYSYLWSNGATAQSITVTTSGSYTVTVSNANGCSATSAPATVTTNAKPATPAITASGPTSFCEGGSVTLTAPSGYTYLWSNGATTQSITVSTAGSYSVTVSNANGCSATSAPATVTVNAKPSPPAITASGSTTFCEGGSVTLTAPSGYTYLWSNGATTQSITVSTPGSYSVTVSNANGCSATSAATTVSTNAKPATPSISASGSTTFCEGGSVTLTAPSGYTYLWSNGAQTQSINVTTSGSYSVTVTNANGCSATSVATSVTVNAKPSTPSISTSGSTTFCEGGSVTLTAPSGFTYLWSNGAQTQSINVTTSGSYSVTVTNGNGCSATSPATTVTVNAKPAAPVITAGGPTTFCEGGSVTLTAPAGYTYLWSNGAQTQSITASAAGSYTVTVTNASGCSATSAPTTITHNASTTISQHPQSATISRNTTAPLSVTASGTGTLTYQWYRGSSGNTSTPVSGATSATYTTPKLSKGTYTYWVRVTGACGSANSNTATITVP